MAKSKSKKPTARAKPKRAIRPAAKAKPRAGIVKQAGKAKSTYWPAQNLNGLSNSMSSWRISCVSAFVSMTVAD